MSNFTTVRDLHKDVLDRCGEISNSDSDFYNKSLEYLNRAHLAVLSGSNELGIEVGEPFVWAKSKNPGVLNLVAPYETGTISVTASSTSATLSVAPSISLAGYYIRVSDRPEYFRVSAHTAATTSITLDATYTDETGSGLSFVAYKFEYQLASGLVRLITPMRVYRNQGWDSNNDGHVDHLDLDTLLEQYPGHLIQRKIPTRFAQTHKDQLGVLTVRFNHPSNIAARVEYEYIPTPSKLVSVEFSDAAVTTGTDLITITDHGLTDGQIVQFDNEGGSLPAGLSKDTNYYVVSSTSSTFKVSTTLGGSAVDITAATGGGTHYVSNLPLVPIEHRVVLSYYAAYFIFMDKNDTAAKDMQALAAAGVESLVQANKRERINSGRYHLFRLVPRLENASSNRRYYVQEVS